MKTRKIIAVVLAVAQLAFGIVLISRGKMLDQEEENHISEIIYCGNLYYFEVSTFFYYGEGDQPIAFNLETEAVGDGRYVEITTDENGNSVLGPGTYDTPPADRPYLDMEKDFYYRMDADNVRSVFGDKTENEFYMPYMIGTSKGKYSIGGKARRVQAAAFVYEGELVFTYLVLGEDLY